MVSQIYTAELKLNKANLSDTEAPFLDMDLSTTNGIISFFFLSFFLYILPDPLSSIIGRCTLYTPGLQDESLQVTISKLP